MKNPEDDPNSLSALHNSSTRNKRSKPAKWLFGYYPHFSQYHKIVKRHTEFKIARFIVFQAEEFIVTTLLCFEFFFSCLFVLNLTFQMWLNLWFIVPHKPFHVPHFFLAKFMWIRSFLFRFRFFHTFFFFFFSFEASVKSSRNVV